MIQGHGGNIYAMARQLGCRPEEIVDMSSNINPLGMLPGLSDHLQSRIDSVSALPEVDSQAAIGSMAHFLEVDPSRMLAGSGTTQFIYTACPALEARNVLIAGPTYADYADACRVHGIEPVHFLATEETRFEVDYERLDQALCGMDTAFICNPNNPTGRLMPHDRLLQLCRQHPKTQFIIDESYLSFAPTDQALTMASCELDNVSVLWSFSKIFGSPGLRAGFLIANRGTVLRFQHFMQPWSLNAMAQEAIAYLGSQRSMAMDYIEKTRSFLEKERGFFIDTLVAHVRMKLYKSVTSYLLLSLPKELKADKVCAHMAKNRILIRNCGNFHGLSHRFVRIALKDPEMNRRVARELAELNH